MGQKIHPTGFRLAVTRNWGSRWFAAGSDFATMLNEDLKVRAHLKKACPRFREPCGHRASAKNARITISAPVRVL
jgi:small subunit ribosomal protein S3